MSNTAAAYARAYVQKYGLCLVKIEPGSKAPKHADWNKEGGYFATAADAESFYLQNPTWNMGAVLGPSRLCSLDVDNVSETKQVLAEFGIDIDQYARDFPTIVGNPSRFRVEFRVPEGVELSRHVLNWPDLDAPSKSHTVFELRAGAVQDVFPPSIHPETQKPYTWLTKPNGHIPEIPEALLAIWKHWELFQPQARELCPWVEKQKSKRTMPYEPRLQNQTFPEGNSVIDAFNKAHDVGIMLERFGYERRGNRWLSPHSHTKLPGVTPLDGNRVFIHHASDPLSSDPPRPVSPFDLFCHYEHNDDMRAAVKKAAKLLGMERLPPPKPIPEPARPEVTQKEVVEQVMPEIQQLSDFEQAVVRLAQLPFADYEVVRKIKAKELHLRATVLDKLVADAKSAQADPEAPLVPIEQNSQFGLWKNLGLDMTKNGPMCNLNNAVLAMSQTDGLAGRIWYDEFSHRINSDLFHKEGEWSDHDTLQMTLALQRSVGLTKINSMQVREAVVLVARQNIRNTPKEYMESLEWDGEERLNKMMHWGWGADPSNYTSAVGRCWMTSMVARVYEPGCKVDTVPVFEGKQGLYKSTALGVIGGKWYAECNEPVNNKDFYMILEGRLLVEIAEMHSFSVGEIRRVKGIISTRVDRYRAPYAATVEDHARQAVLACTTNEDEWNRDPTGARRFWPIKCHRIDLDWLSKYRDQFFAEAVHRYKTDHIWHDVPTEEAAVEQSLRRVVDSWDEYVMEYVACRDSMTTKSIMESALDMPAALQTPVAMQRVSSIMRANGWEQRMGRIDGVKCRRWFRADAPVEAEAPVSPESGDLPFE